MKRLCTLVILLMLLLLATEAFCSTVLISVELPTIESQKSWHQLGIPTYELIGNTAIAEAEEQQVPLLKQKGYQIGIIDRQPDLSKYVIMPKTDKLQAPMENPIWQNDKSAIIKSMPIDVFKQKEYRHKIRSLNATPLGDRFWKSVTTNYVSIKSLPYDPLIQNLVDQVNADSIASYIQRLQNFGPRYTLTDSNYAASEWIKQKFEAWGYVAVFDSFYAEENYPDTIYGYGRNILATEVGECDSSITVIVEGHIDTAPFTPGADDNASGTAGMMEIARIMKGNVWETTAQYIGFDAEEIGLLGSLHYAALAESNAVNIKSVINLDMIGYTPDSTLSCTTWYGNEGSYTLSALLSLAGKIYVPELTIVEEYEDGAGDYGPFSDRGYDAIGLRERYSVNPNYHGAGDTLSTLYSQLFAAITKAALAVAAIENMYPKYAEGVEVTDIGDGCNLQVVWTESKENDVVGYEILWGLQSGNYIDSLYKTDRTITIDTINGLLRDSTYYITIRAVDAMGHISPRSIEVLAIPRLEPITPSIISAPIAGGIDLNWKKNNELDFAGYRIYKAKSVDAIYDSLNTTLIIDTCYTDKPLTGEYTYYYKVRSFDLGGNYSPLSDSTFCRPISLDQGILVVDETNNWTTGSFPRDAQQDSFYNYIMTGYKYAQYEYGPSTSNPVLADFGPYSTVVWLTDDYVGMLASGSINDLKGYLDNGGKLWFAGWKPNGDIHNTLTYPADYTTGDISYDYFNITHAGLSGTADSFKTAVGLKGYPDIAVDTLKYPTSIWGKALRYIEALTPTGTGDTIYVIDMKNDGSTFEGRACAVRDSGRTVFFGFPMYFMDREQAKLAAQKVLEEFGEEPLGVSGEREDLGLVTGTRLYQNSPNPFSRETIIRYQISQPGKVSLKVYNIQGQLVKVLDEGHRTEGEYGVKWNGRDGNDRQVSNGIYFYSLCNGTEIITNRLIMIK
jgi:hypothetical protein